MYEGLLDRESLTSEDGGKHVKNTLRPLYQRSSECFLLEIFFNLFVRSKKHEDGQVDWDIFITPQAFERLLDGYATNKQHE